jgi:hypothetical protein
MSNSKRNRKRRKSKLEKKNTNRNTYLIGALVVLLAGYWGLIQFSEGTFINYPDFVEGVFYPTPVISIEDSTISISTDFLKENKMVFFDLKLEKPTAELTYQGRVIPLEWYKEGQYLPGLVISTPKGNTVAGIRVCEPCGSFSFHIVEKKYLQCDPCGTRWEIEDFSKGEGGCEDFPPPMLAVNVGKNVEVNVAETGLRIVT